MEEIFNWNVLTTYLQDHIPNLITFALKVVFAIVVFLIGRAVIHLLRRIVKRSMERAQVDTGVKQFVDSLVNIALYVFLIFLIATNFGFDATSAAAILASCGLAIGLALQGSLSNFAGGVLILVLKPFVVGDYIVEESSGYEGTVMEIQLFYTRLLTIDSRTVVIPNGNLSNNSLINVTQQKERQLDLKVNISYRADLEKAKDVIARILEEDAGVLRDRPQSVFVHDLADSAVVLGVRAWTNTEDYFPVRWRLLEEIKLALDENQIEIPYPQVSVHMADS